MGEFAFNRVSRSNNLTSELVQLMRDKIEQGHWESGIKLPSSKYIEEQAGVSRTVVREAVAQLKAEGLLTSKQGVGVFVTQKPKTTAFSIDKAEFESVYDALHILQLRMAVEVEISAIAALQRTTQQMDEIASCYKQISISNNKGEDSISDDFKFHKAIAKASGNPYFLRFIEFIGAGVIPAREIVSTNVAENTYEYTQIIQAEHLKIVDAIKCQDPDAARQAMKSHLDNSIERHKRRIKAI